MPILVTIVGGLEHFLMTFHNFIIPTDFHIFFRGVGWNHQPVNIQTHLISAVAFGISPEKPPGLATHCRLGSNPGWWSMCVAPVAQHVLMPRDQVPPYIHRRAWFPWFKFSTEALLLRSLIREPITLCLVCFVFVFCVFFCVWSSSRCV